MTHGSLSNQLPAVIRGHAQQQQVGEQARVLHPDRVKGHVKHAKLPAKHDGDVWRIGSHPTAAAQDTPERRSQTHLDQDLRRRSQRSELLQRPLLPVKQTHRSEGSQVTASTHLQGALWKRRYEKKAKRTKKMRRDSSSMKRDWTIREFSRTES